MTAPEPLFRFRWWRCKDGRCKRVREMDDMHVVHSVRMILRNRKGWRAGWLPIFYQEMSWRLRKYDEEKAARARDVSGISIRAQQGSQSRRSI